VRLLFALLLSLFPLAAADFFPVAVWYGGGKARAPRLEAHARQKKELWRRDVRQIKSLGFNTIRAWVDWASAEPRQGAYDFETLDVLLELADEEGLRLLLQVYMDSAPAWVGRLYPDSLFVSSNGAVIHPEASPGYCLDHPGVHQADQAFYRALAAHLKEKKAFLGFDLWSEPHVINWATPTYLPNPEFCFCPHTLARFRSWLKAKYKTLDALNAAWYRRFESWDEVEPGRLSTILSFTDYIDWKAFIVDKLGEDLGGRAAAVRATHPAAIVSSHAAGVGLFASPHHWEGQSDDWTMAAQVDFYGTSFYPKHSAFVDRDASWRAALWDFTRSFAYDQGRQGFYVGELQSGFGTIALNVSPTVTPADLNLWTWSALARGAKGICFYAFYPMSAGYESGGFGLIELDGTLTERAKTAGSVAAFVDKNQRLFLNARPPRAEIAILYNPLAHFVGGRQRAATYGGPQGEVAGIERDSLLGAHKALLEQNLAVDYLHANHLTLEQLRPYKLVLLNYPLMLPSTTAAVLKEYVAQGGHLVAEARPAWNDERGLAAETIPGQGLAEVFGARESAIQTGDKGRTTLRWTATTLPGLQPGDQLPGRWFEESLAPTRPTSHIMATLPDGSPAAIESEYGKGKTLMLGSYLSAAYQSTPTPAAQRLYGALAAWAGAARAVRVSGSPLESQLLDSAGETLLFLFNHNPTKALSEIELARQAGAASNLRTGAAIPVERTAGALRLSVEIPPLDVLVVRFARP